MKETGSFNIREILNKLLFHWPLFLLFLGLSFAIAVFYLSITNPLYIVRAKILIKDEKNKASEATALRELNLNESSKSVDTEIGLLTSRPTIEQVVVDLQLWVTYLEPSSYFTYKDIYSTTPVQFKLLKAKKDLKVDHFNILIKSKNEFVLVQTDNKTKTVPFSENINNYFGTWKLDTTAHINEYIGKTIRIDLINPKYAILKYQNKIGAENFVKTNPAIDLSIEDEVPERGRAILNDLLRVYMDASVDDKRKSTQSTLQFVDDRLTSLTGELNGIESKYSGYKSTRGITDVTAESTKFLTDVQTTDKQINDINIQLSVVEGIEQYVNSDQGSNNAPAIIGMNDPALAAYVKQLSDLQLQRSKLLVTLPESNPLFNPINQQIKDTKIAIQENLKGIKASLLRTRSQIQGIGAVYQSSIRNIPVHERELVDIKRMQGIKENLYVYLQQKKEEIGIDYASTIADARIEEQAHYGDAESPIPNKIYAIAFLAGILFPVGIIFGRDAIKNKVLSKNEILISTGAPVISELINELSDNPFVILNQGSYIGEQFRDLRTKINYLHQKNERGKVTLITSSISGEGKSFVSSNLAATLAVSGKKIIILELDLRRPKLYSIFKLEDKTLGISDYLIGNATINEIIQNSGILDNLFIISSGTIPPNPSELLESDELITLFNTLRKEYDHILIDSPPMHLVTDAMILAPLCDISLYVVRQDYTPKHELEFIQQLFIDKTLPRMNIIFNGIENDKHGYGYSYSNNSYYVKSPKKIKNSIRTFYSRF